MALVYIHGFNSSPASLKARQTDEWLSLHHPHIPFFCPRLSNQPDLAIQQLQALIEQTEQPVGLVGSSMGGYYATWLAEQYGLPSVLINPAVKPYELMLDYLGENANYHTRERYVLEQRHVEAVRQLEVSTPLNPSRYWVLLQTGDEVLDYRQAESRYTGCRMTIEQGGDHSFQHYERYLPAIFEFLQLSSGFHE
ncbi:YqiA/YcfP family alpha/beta fold hydrolase [Porticoccus sp.]